MKDEKKTKKLLLEELRDLRRQVDQLSSFGIKKALEQRLPGDTERYFELADLLPQSIYEIGTDGMVAFANRCALDSFGYTETDLEAGIHFLQVLIPEERNRAKQDFQDVLSGKRKEGIEYTALKKDGGTFPVLFYADPIIRDGRTVGQRGIAIDITDWKRAEERLKKTEMQYENTLDSIDEAIHVVDRDLRIVLFNARFTRWVHQLGLVSEKNNVIGRTIFDLFPFLPESVGEEYRLVFQNGKILCTNESNMAGGELIFTETRKIPILENGKVARVLTVVRNVTERKKMEAALKKREERYRQLFNKCNDSMFFHELSGTGTFGKFLEVNDVACLKLGYTREAIMNMTAEDLICPEDKGRISDILKDLFDKKHVIFEINYLTRDKRKIPCEINAHLFKFDGKTSLLSIARDITERKQVEIKLSENEARYRAVVEDQTELICRFLPDCTLTFVNGAYCRYFNKRPEELIGKKFIPLIPPEDQQIIQKNISSLSRQHPVMTHEHRVNAPDGKTRWQQWTNRAIFDERGRLMEFQAVGRDITRRKLMEENLVEAKAKLEKQYAELKKVDKMKDTLIRDVTHELKTPVAKCSMQMEILREIFHEGGITKEAKKALRVMGDSIRRQEKVINNILNVARLETGKMLYSSETFRLDKLLENVLSEYLSDFEIFDILLDLKLKPAVLHSDKNMLWHVFSNIVSNAIKCRNPDLKPLISILLEEKEQKFLVTIADNGIGLGSEDLEKVFEKFYKTIPAVEGSGVGLSIARKIVEDLGGHIWIESPGKGKGASVFVRLPK